MSGFRIKYKVLAISVCLVFAGWAAVSAEEFLPVSEVREGMRGYAKTVVHGTQVETFDVDVLGVMKQKGATGGDLILVKVSGDLIDKTEGIAQGMSGSPVYINGKLLGAIAYGFPQSGGRIGMVTPISDMLDLWLTDNKKSAYIPKPSSDLIPIDTPLMASGYSAGGMEYLSDKMQDFHMIPFSAVSVDQDTVARPLEAGGAVAASLVTGDLKLGAIGTVTYVDGNQMLAFGHPFMSRGNTGYFMHNSYIFTVIPSKNIPFKLGSVGAEIGTVNQDRGAGIGGISGTSPDFVALHAFVKDKDTGVEKDLNVRMIQNESLLPTLSATSVYNAISTAMDRRGQGTVKFTYTLHPKDMKQKPFTRTNMYWSSTDIAERSVDEIYQIVKLLEQNRFESYALRNISMDMEVTQERNTAKILDASASPIVVSPGDTIYVRARLQPWRGEVFYKDLSFDVPEDQPLGNMVLEVRGGGVVPLPYLLQQQKYNLTEEILSRLRSYKNFDDLHGKLMKEDQNNQVVVEIIDPDVSMVSKEEDGKVKAEIQNKPAGKDPVDLKKKEGGTGLDTDKESPKSRVDTDYVIYGDGQFTFKVMNPSDRDTALKKLAKSNKKLSAKMTTEEKKLIDGEKTNENTDKNKSEKSSPGPKDNGNKGKK